MKETMIETFSPEETHALGKKIGQQAKPGDVYTLIGDLGVGKTVFTQGIAEGDDRKRERICGSFRSENVGRRDECRISEMF